MCIFPKYWYCFARNYPVHINPTPERSDLKSSWFFHTQKTFFFFACLVTSSLTFATLWLQLTKLFCPWGSGKNTEVASTLPLGIFPTQRLNLVSHIEGECFTDWAIREMFFIGCSIKSGRNASVVFPGHFHFCSQQWRKGRHYKNPPKKIISSHINKRGDCFLYCLGYTWRVRCTLGGSQI